MLALCLTLSTSGGVGACGAPAHTPQVPRAPANDDTLGADDVFEVRVFGEDDLTGAYRVAYDGTIDFPLVGRLAVAGRTPPQVAELLASRLREGQFLLHPQVSVLVKEYNSRRISVFGQVQRPGTFPFQDSMDIVHAITLAGGFTQLADENATTVTRRRGDRERRFRIPVRAIGQGRAASFYLEPGDTVYVPENPL